MLDLKWIRDYPEELDLGLSRRGMPGMSDKILTLDRAHREVQTKLQEYQSERNRLAKEIPAVKSRGGNIEALLVAANEVKESIPRLEEEMATIARELEDILITLPNLLLSDVPQGADEKSNVCLRVFSEPPQFDFEPKQHFELGATLHQMDFAQTSLIAGARFVTLSKDLAQLERALGNFMVDVHTQQFNYMEVSPPLLVKGKALFGTGQLPKFADDSFKTTDDRYLIPTSEVPLTNLVAERILEREELPLRFVARTPCFRSEAGAAGKDTRGMIRQHQFWKVELVSITTPDDSSVELERMTQAAEEILKKLELPYRVMVLCSGDTGAAAQKTFDLEVWLPGQNTYREISSCSLCGDYHARRMKARFKDKGLRGSATQYVHTLNGSGVAIGRALIAIMENYQQADGSIRIPQVLIPYMNGKEEILLS